MRKKQFNTLVLFSYVLFFLGSCSPEEVTTGGVEQGAFFDLKSYFESQLIQLENIQTIEKAVEVNGEKEVKTLSTVDFSKELAAFLKTDINRLAWRDKYQVDSTFTQQGELVELKYNALDEEMKTQLLSVGFKNKIVDRVYIENRVNGFAVSNSRKMTYTPKGGFTIDSQQKPMLGATQNIRIAVRFEN